MSLQKKINIMWLGVIIFLCQVFSCGFAEESSCTPGFDSESFVFKVNRDHLHRGKTLGRVIFNACDVRSRSVFQSGDKRFSVRTDGSVTLKTPVTLHDGYMMFDVHAWDSSVMKHTASVRVECTAHHHEDHHMNTAVNITTQMKSFPDDLIVRFPRSSEGLKRVKRGWVIPPLRETENSYGPFPQFLAQIKSDYAKETTLIYSITGEGADQPPVGLFTCDSRTGEVHVTQPLDREKKASYKLIAHAVGEGGVTEKPMEIIIEVIDQNDHRPEFTQNPFNGKVPEAAPKDYEFMTVTATDADDPKTTNTDLRYKIISQDPPLPNPNMFDINSVTGGIRVDGSGLDREKWPKYTLVLQATDQQGKGFPTDGKAVIIVTDSNDNPPQFEPETYTVSVPENQVGVEVAKLTVTDDDEPGSPAWSTKYKIISGDKLGVFSISTGPSQLEGIITTVKPLDYEKTKQYILSVIVENDDSFVGPLPTSTATVTVNVVDVNEPPVFNPKQKHITKPEDVPVGSDLVAFTATDPDIGRAQKLTYRIGSDPAGFLSVVEDTGMIKVKSPMDRESIGVKNGKYKALILAVDSDAEARATGTGTLIIQLEDVNDNAPYINEREIKICNQEAPPVLLSITDKDLHPNAGPFSVETHGDTRKNWTAKMNDSATGIELRLKSALEPGVYNVVLRVYDRQNLYQDSTIRATVCDCKGESVTRAGVAEAKPTVTGTLIIKLEDVNDNAPYINEREIKICNQEAPPVLLSITDKDLHPNAGPFSVETQGDTMKNWTAKMNDSATGIELMLKSALKPGVYSVVLRVFDNQKLYQDSTIKATVCDCKGESVVCSETRTARLSLSVIIRIICTIVALVAISFLLVYFMRQQICFGQGGV